jgi:hypothetical protein
VGRQHSLTKNCVPEATIERWIFGDELEQGAVASRPKGRVTIFRLYDSNAAAQVETTTHGLNARLNDH